MYNTRLPILIVSTALALTAIMAGQAYNPSGSTQEITQSNSGTGDPGRVILELPSEHARARESGQPYTGSDWIERHPTLAIGANTYIGSDWIEQHPTLATGANTYIGSDWIERHPTLAIAEDTYFGSDWIERHPTLATGANTYNGSDWIERHPTLATAEDTYIGSDWIERHPTGTNFATNQVQEGDQANLSVGFARSENGHTYAGTGDPFRFKAKPSIPNSGMQENGHTYSGTGDPLR